MPDEQHIQQQINKHVQWIIEAKGHKEATKLPPLLDRSFSLMTTAIRLFEDKQYDKAISHLDKLLEINRHSYLFTQPWVVQAGIYGKDILRESERHSECLMWVLYALSVIMTHEPELRDPDDLAEMFMLLLDEMLNIRDAPIEIVRQKLLDMAWDGSGKWDSVSDGLSALAVSHLLLLTGDFDRAQKSLEDAENKLGNVDRNSLAWAMRCCVLAEIKANTGKYDESMDAARISEDIYRARERTSNVFSLSRSQGELLFLNSAWSQSGDAFMRAVDAGNDLYRSALMRTDQEERLADVGNLYRHGAYAMARANANRLPIAAVLLEQGRARILGDGIARDFANLERIRKDYPNLHERYGNSIQELRRYEQPLSGMPVSEIRESVRKARINIEEVINSIHGKSIQELRRYEQPLSEIPVSEIRESVRKARVNFEEVINSIREIRGYEHFLKDAMFDDIVAAVEPDHPIIYLATIEVGTIALMVYKKGEGGETDVDIILEPFSKLTSDWLSRLVGSVNPVSQGWLGAHEEYRSAWRYPIQERKHLLDKLMDVIDHTNDELWKLMGHIVDHLNELRFTRAVLVPGGLLGLVPLHTASSKKGSSCRYALDTVTFTYAPSARTLHHARRIAGSTRADTLVAIVNPASMAPSLRYAAEEVNYVGSFFKEDCKTILDGDNACSHNILEALPSAQVFHFSAHAHANLLDPMSSGLSVAGDKWLTVREIMSNGMENISVKNRGRLAVLSACETGVVGTRLPDEVVGLATAFMRMGFAGVLASLWVTNDESTFMLIKEFYDQWIGNGKRPDKALVLAQKQVRTEHRFAHPYYWAGFYFMGA